MFSGDAVQHPLLPSGQDIYFLSGTDRRQAFASRTASRELARDNAAVGANRFPGLRVRSVARTAVVAGI